MFVRYELGQFSDFALRYRNSQEPEPTYTSSGSGSGASKTGGPGSYGSGSAPLYLKILDIIFPKYLLLAHFARTVIMALS